MELHAKFKVKVESFEGPLDLLLGLIEKRRLLINDISLAKVTDDYIEYLKQHEKFPVKDSADFILIASTLLLIKSKSLLPELSLTEEEAGNIEDLERRLKIYKEIKELSQYVKERFGIKLIFGKSETRNITPVFAPPESITLKNIEETIDEIIKNFPRKESAPIAVVKKVISIEEMIESLTQRIKRNMKMSFHEFSKYGKAEKIHVIVSFLAMLELVKQGIIDVHQEANEGDIRMETEEVGVPRYE